MPRAKKSQGAYVISVVAERFQVHPQTLRLYEREGLLKPSRTDGNTRLYTEGDLERLEFILNMRERMGEMQRQMQAFVNFVRGELAVPTQAPHDSKALVRVRQPMARAIAKKP